MRIVNALYFKTLFQEIDVQKKTNFYIFVLLKVFVKNVVLKMRRRLRNFLSLKINRSYVCKINVYVCITQP